MRYATAAAFRQALDDRLKSEAPAPGCRSAVCASRSPSSSFCAASSRSHPTASCSRARSRSDLRLKATTRPIRDIDLGRDDDEQAAIEDITAAQQLVLNDFFTYVAIRTDESHALDQVC